MDSIQKRLKIVELLTAASCLFTELDDFDKKTVKQMVKNLLAEMTEDENKDDIWFF